ncbi:MAG: hypothetical protein MZV70_62565, partial [Desulfobacterales bacterium]|nr:hypothetical protein [Desulfobacterales bacterium]
IPDWLDFSKFFVTKNFRKKKFRSLLSKQSHCRKRLRGDDMAMKNCKTSAGKTSDGVSIAPKME